MWKKRKDIEGVSSGSIIDLKAVLFQEEQTAKTAPHVGAGGGPEARPKKIQTVIQNRGIAERNERDLEARTKDDHEASDEVREAKLREKSHLYNNMVKGGYLNNEEEDDPYNDNRSYLVDFQQKDMNNTRGSNKRKNDFGYAYADSDTVTASGGGYGSKSYNSGPVEETRKLWEREAAEEANRERDQQLTRSRKMDIVDDVAYETRKGREKHQESKMKRKQALEERMKLVKERALQRHQSTTNNNQQPTITTANINLPNNTVK